MISQPDVTIFILKCWSSKGSVNVVMAFLKTLQNNIMTHEVDIVEVVEEEQRPDESQIEFVIDESEMKS